MSLIESETSGGHGDDQSPTTAQSIHTAPTPWGISGQGSLITGHFTAERAEGRLLLREKVGDNQSQNSN